MGYYDSERSTAKVVGVLATLAVLIIGGIIFGVASCTLVEPGNVGIKIERAGANRGVQDLPIVSGWVSYNPFTETVIEFPTTVQTAIWTANAHEGSSHDESISFSSSDGVTITADVALSYHVDAQHAGRLYTRFRVTDLNGLTHGYVRNLVRDAINERASLMDVHSIYGSGKTRLLTEALALVRERVGNDGFVIDQLSFQGALRLPQNVVDAINRSMQATQDAVTAQNRVAQTEAEARQHVAQVQGEANAARARAEGEAAALHIQVESQAAATIARARADAEARRILAQATADSWRIEGEGTAQQANLIRPTLSPDLIRYWSLMHWNGHLPQITGGTTPMITLPSLAAP